jgi:DNA-binding transcriptional ArsR family regulator
LPLDALGDPTRRKLFERLRGGPRSVGELVTDSGISQPAVSQHLSVLRAAGLVSSRKAGQRRIYAIDPTGLAELRAYIESFWDGALSAFQAAAEEQALEENKDD